MAHPGVDLIRELLGDRATTIPTVEQRRTDLEALAGSVPAPDEVAVRSLTVGGRPAERYDPPSPAGPGLVLYLHGGGYVSGSLATHRGFAGKVALASGHPVVSLDYRLAPEHPYPAGADDAMAALAELGADEPVVVAGDSAGGGLTMTTLLRARDEGGPQPRAGVLVSPWVDLGQTLDSHRTRADVDPMLSPESLTDLAGHYLQGHDPADPLVSPAIAGDLSGLPPLRIDVGDAEVLLDDSVQLAARVRDAGGTAELTVWDEMVHVFPAYPPDLLPEAGSCVEAIGAFVAQHLGAA